MRIVSSGMALSLVLALIVPPVIAAEDTDGPSKQ